MEIHAVGKAAAPSPRPARHEVEQLARDVVETGAVLMVRRSWRMPWQDPEKPITAEKAAELLVEGEVERLRVKPRDSSVPLHLQDAEDLREVVALNGGNANVAHPGNAKALRDLAEAGWRFHCNGAEVGLYGAYNGLEGVTAQRNGVTLPLKPDQIEKVRDFYLAATPSLAARLEADGYRFFDGSVPIAAFQARPDSWLARDGDKLANLGAFQRPEDIQDLDRMRARTGEGTTALVVWSILRMSAPVLERAEALADVNPSSEQAARVVNEELSKLMGGEAEFDRVFEGSRELAPRTRRVLLKQALLHRGKLDQTASWNKMLEEVRSFTGEDEALRALEAMLPLTPIRSGDLPLGHALADQVTRSHSKATIWRLLMERPGVQAAEVELARAWPGERHQSYYDDGVALGRALMERLRPRPVAELALEITGQEPYRDCEVLDEALQAVDARTPAELGTLGLQILRHNSAAGPAILERLEQFPAVKQAQELIPHTEWSHENTAIAQAALDYPEASPAAFAERLAARFESLGTSYNRVRVQTLEWLKGFDETRAAAEFALEVGAAEHAAVSQAMLARPRAQTPGELAAALAPAITYQNYTVAEKALQKFGGPRARLALELAALPDNVSYYRGEIAKSALSELDKASEREVDAWCSELAEKQTSLGQASWKLMFDRMQVRYPSTAELVGKLGESPEILRAAVQHPDAPEKLARQVAPHLDERQQLELLEWLARVPQWKEMAELGRAVAEPCSRYSRQRVLNAVLGHLAAHSDEEWSGAVQAFGNELGSYSSTDATAGLKVLMEHLKARPAFRAAAERALEVSERIPDYAYYTLTAACQHPRFGEPGQRAAFAAQMTDHLDDTFNREEVEALWADPAARPAAEIADRLLDRIQGSYQRRSVVAQLFAHPIVANDAEQLAWIQAMTERLGNVYSEDNAPAVRALLEEAGRNPSRAAAMALARVAVSGQPSHTQIAMARQALEQAHASTPAELGKLAEQLLAAQSQPDPEPVRQHLSRFPELEPGLALARELSEAAPESANLLTRAALAVAPGKDPLLQARMGVWLADTAEKAYAGPTALPGLKGLLERLESLPGTRRACEIGQRWAEAEPALHLKIARVVLEDPQANSPEELHALAARAAALRSPKLVGPILAELDKRPETRPLAELCRSWQPRLAAGMPYLLEAALKHPARLDVLVETLKAGNAAYALTAKEQDELGQEALKLAAGKPVADIAAKTIEGMNENEKVSAWRLVFPHLAATQPEELVGVGQEAMGCLPLSRNVLRYLASNSSPLSKLAEMHVVKLKDDYEDQSTLITAWRELSEQAEALAEIRRLAEARAASGVKVEEATVTVGGVRIRTKN